MASTTTPRELTDGAADRAPRAREGGRQRRAEAHRPGGFAASGADGPADRPARRSDPSGVLLRHPELALYGTGLVVRARRIQGKGDDSVVKLRPVVPHELPESWRASPSFGVEVDAMPGGFVCSGSMKASLPAPRVKEAVSGDRPLRKLFSKEQRAFYAEQAPEGLALDDLTTLGPIFVLKVKFAPPELGRKMVGELWLYPDDSRLLELSTKCAPGETFQVAAEARAFLGGRGVDMTGEQETKTKKALEFFAERLAAKGG